MWDRVLALAEPKPSIHAAVNGLRLQTLERGVATLEAPDSTAFAYAKARQGVIESLLQDVVGERIRVEIRAPGTEDHAPPPDAVLQAEALKNPLVRRAMELFEARLIAAGPDDEAKPKEQ